MICESHIAYWHENRNIRQKNIDCAFHFSRRRISPIWFYRFSSELYFVKTGAREDSDETGIQNYGWKTGLAAVLFSFTWCNFSSESGTTSRVFRNHVILKREWKRKREREFYLPATVACYRNLSNTVSRKENKKIIKAIYEFRVKFIAISFERINQGNDA